MLFFNRRLSTHSWSTLSLHLLFLLTSLLCHLVTFPSTAQSVTATTDINEASPTKSTKLRSTSTSNSISPSPSPTPTIVIPPQCKGCFGPNNTSGMICYKNTQCVPSVYLCDVDDSCTDSDGDQDPDSPIYCQNQLCTPRDFLPFPSPGSGKMDLNTSDCREGNYYSLFGTDPKYTRTCIEVYQDTPVHCQPWEYAYQSSCFLSTCGPGLDCARPFECIRSNDMDLHGICLNPNGKSSGQNKPGGGVFPQHSKSYLVQGLVIGICCLVLGIGLGVGYWRYKRRHTKKNNSGADNTTHTIKNPSWFSRLFPFRKPKSRITIDRTMDRTSTQESRDSTTDSESINASFVSLNRPTNAFPGRWRWAQGNSRFNFNRSVATQGHGGIYPEIEPPPMYHAGPDLPTYVDTIEEIDMNNIRQDTATSDLQHASENRRISNNSIGTS